MKKAILPILGCIIMLPGLYSQDSSARKQNVITVSPFGLVNKVRFKYERVLNDHFSTGGFASGYYGLGELVGSGYKGFQLSPIFRWYPGKEAPHGLYLQAKVVIARHVTPLWYFSVSDTTQQTTYKHSFASAGGGLGVGFQVLSGKDKNIILDFGIGFKLVTPMPMPNTRNQYYLDETFFVIKNGIYYATGPGSIFDGLIAFGLAF